ncbi:LysM peptidoglycan-binding domain-containing protein [Streptomyces sp. NPDC056883]|uniref:LysM peptidoglycan-binding domain-containing protein n=1 Tax=Streptomyces sp. NPDC056883 TaxID=3345959 RepID=UPI0036935BFF
MATRTPAPLRALGRLFRALLGLVALIALVAGIPILLLAVGHQPTELAAGWDLLTQQDDGSLFLTALTCIGWAAWALFAFSTLVELFALLRRQKAPRLRGLGGLQSLAGFLIGSIVLLAPAAAANAATPPAAATVSALQTNASGGTSATSTPASSNSSAAPAPKHTVSSSTELPWDLAEQYLGDGKRWKDIAALNPTIPELVAGDQYLPQGVVLTLPADAHPAGPAAAHTPPSPGEQSAPAAAGPSAAVPAAGTTETVQPADTLSDIADRHGEADDWPALFEANRGKPQPGGGTFTDPDLIYPGQVLDLPQSWTTTPPPTTAEVPAKPPAADTDTHTPSPGTDEPSDQAQQPAPPSATPATPPPSSAAPSTPAPVASPTPTTPHHETPEATVAEDEDSDTALPAAVFMGAGALAAALVGTLTVRRILQQRRRRPGRRIAMPSGRAAETEQQLRAAQHPTGFALLDRALRSLALNLAGTGRDLPAIEAVVVHDTKIELHLAHDSAPMKPFTAAVARQSLWTCSASSPHLADDDALKTAEVPYPALVSLGWDTAGHLVMVDLEHIGILHLGGDADFAQHVLQAIAVELASTPLPGHLEVTTYADAAAGLETAVPERVVRASSLSEAADELVDHTADQRRTLAALGATSLRAARLLDDAGDSWTPHILLAQDLAHGDVPTFLLDALTATPRAAGAFVVSGTGGSAAAGWSLDCQGPDGIVMLPGSNLPIRLQGLNAATFADAIELLTIADTDTDVPAPAGTRSDNDEDDIAGIDIDGAQGHPVEPGQPSEDLLLGADIDGLPDEYDEPMPDDAISADLAEASEDQDDAGPTPPTANTPLTPITGEAAGPVGLTLADVLAEDDALPTKTLGSTTPACSAAGPAVHVTIPEPAPLPPESSDAQGAAEDEPARTESADAAAPSVLLLGPVLIEGATGRIDSSRRTVSTELIAYLALNTGVDHHAIDNALWPGHLGNPSMRSGAVSRTRSWLGKDAEGKPHFPLVQDTGDSRYRLGPAVTCDWTRFQRLAHTGLAHHDEDGDLALRRALALVRGRPFEGTNPRRYAWAEPAIQEMISTITDVAHELSTRRREAGDTATALWAARQGLLACEENEVLHRCLFLAHHTAGDLGALRDAAARLAHINEQLGGDGGVDMEAETSQLLQNLLPRPNPARTRSRQSAASGSA